VLEQPGRPDELDVILYLRTAETGTPSRQIREQHLAGIVPLSDEVRAIERRYRPPWSLREEEEKLLAAGQSLAISPEDRARRDELNLEIDRRLSVMRREVHRSLELRTARERAEVTRHVESHGGRVNGSILVIHALDATIPAASLRSVAEHPLVKRIIKRSTPVDELDNSCPSVEYTAWWNDAGVYDGGSYDAGVIDSGLQGDHPAFSSVDFHTNGSALTDSLGHGTHVAGIIASGDATYQGTAHGLDKVFWAHRDDWFTAFEDLMNLASTTDTPEAINLSQGDGRANDVDYGDRDSFFDVFVENYNTMVVKSAGNGGWGVTTITHPAPAYNLIAVANMDDQDTLGRADDVRSTQSSVGPTLDGRWKPDLSAPGSDIMSTHANWDDTTAAPKCNRNRTADNDFADCSGTSMAAPHVTGAIVLMEDGGNHTPMAQKAVLINTADWWDSAGTDATGDDGQVTATSGYATNDWDEAYGWGYIDMWESHFNRGDYFTGSLVPRNDTAVEDDYKLYAGQMFVNEKATLVWQKRGVYAGDSAPTTTYSLADLNLRLYDETDGTLDDVETDGDDNVHQVAATDDVSAVIKVYAWSTSFSGATTEDFALAVEENFAAVDFPDSFGGIGNWPSTVQPGEQFTVEFWVRNDSDIASHGNSFDLILPVGFSRVSGADPASVGSAPGAAGFSDSATWTIQAPITEGPATIQVQHSHSSYAEDYGPHTWNMGTTVVTDIIPPTPDPMTWGTEPFELNTSQIQMVATTASDPHGPIAYYHEYMGSPTGGTGGSHSGWVDQTNTDSGLLPNHEYCYRIWARDNPTTTPNLTAPSATSCDYTAIETPTGITFGTITTSSIQARSTNTPSNLTFGSSGLNVHNVTTGDASGWKRNNDLWTSPGLTANSPYTFRAYARNGDGTTTPFTPLTVKYTLARVPVAGTIFPPNDTVLRVTWDTNGNPAGTEYLAENLTTGTDSGWTTLTTWDSGPLVCGNPYTFQVRARNGDLVETVTLSLGNAVAGLDFEGDGLPDCVDPDDDDDGAEDVNDCRPLDASVWAVPGEARNVHLTHTAGVTQLMWQPPVAPGTSAPLFYDTIESKSANLWGPADGRCLEQDDWDMSASHADLPSPGVMFFFLTRPQNRCGDGDVGVGQGAGGAPIPRNVLDCGCAHAMCDEGDPLDPACDPCVASICAVDDYCCSTYWDHICVGEVASVCGEACP
jgi:hypothetical protein